MKQTLTAPDSKLLDRRILALVGGYGAGKTQVSISLALRWAGLGQRVALVDLDLINPYFRSREISGFLSRAGVEAIRPQGDLAFAENPSLVPEIDGALRDPSRRVVLDAGGNETGATILGRYHPLLTGEHAAIVQVVNVFRPFSTTTAEIESLRAEIEGKSRCRVQGWINNCNLQDWTTLTDWLASVAIIDDLVRESGIPLAGYAVNPEWASKVGLAWDPAWIPIKRYLSLGWKSSYGERGSSNG